MPIGIIDAYWDDEGQALCPMATGISHHINPCGDIEPCPIIQFATETIHDERGLMHDLPRLGIPADFRELARKTTRGCIVLERPDLVKELVVKHGARHDAARRRRRIARARRDGQPQQPAHAGQEVPEEHWMYRFAKKHWFFGFVQPRLIPDLTRSRQQQFQIFAAQVADQAVVGADDRVGQVALGLLQLQHLFLDRVPGDQPVGEDLAGLADAVGAVDRLRFDGRVPPGVEQEDVLGRGQVQAEAAGLQADQEQLAVRVVLEALDARLAVARAAVEVLVGDASPRPAGRGRSPAGW